MLYCSLSTLHVPVLPALSVVHLLGRRLHLLHAGSAGHHSLVVLTVLVLLPSSWVVFLMHEAFSATRDHAAWAHACLAQNCLALARRVQARLNVSLLGRQSCDLLEHRH